MGPAALGAQFANTGGDPFVTAVFAGHSFGVHLRGGNPALAAGGLGCARGRHENENPVAHSPERNCACGRQHARNDEQRL
jgi:hypothetical protein